MKGYRYVHAHPARGWVSYSRTEGIHVTTKNWWLWLRARVARAWEGTEGC